MTSLLLFPVFFIFPLRLYILGVFLIFSFEYIIDAFLIYIFNALLLYFLLIYWYFHTFMPINPLASPSAGATALKYGDVNRETTSPGEVKGLNDHW